MCVRSLEDHNEPERFDPERLRTGDDLSEFVAHELAHIPTDWYDDELDEDDFFDQFEDEDDFFDEEDFFDDDEVDEEDYFRNY